LTKTSVEGGAHDEKKLRQANLSVAKKRLQPLLNLSHGLARSKLEVKLLRKIVPYRSVSHAACPPHQLNR
jgi:hypothetical protein